MATICRRRSTPRPGIQSIFPLVVLAAHGASGRSRRRRPRAARVQSPGSERRGHIVEVGPDWSEGRLTAAARDGRRRRAAANPRGMQGYAAGR